MMGVICGWDGGVKGAGHQRDKYKLKLMQVSFLLDQFVFGGPCRPRNGSLAICSSISFQSPQPHPSRRKMKKKNNFRIKCSCREDESQHHGTTNSKAQGGLGGREGAQEVGQLFESSETRRRKKKKKKRKKQVLQQGWAHGATLLLAVEPKRICYQARNISLVT